MKKAVQFCFVVLAMFCPFAASISRACQCREPQPVCAEYRGADVVFTGQVSKITRIEDGVRSQVTFSVDRAFKGMTGDSIELIKWGSSCDYSFKEHHNYLVYAFRNTSDGSLTTWECSRTRERSAAGEDIRFIDRTLLKSETAIIGVLADGEKRLKNVPVIVKGGKHEYRTTTNESGWFRINLSAPGKQVVQIRLPSGSDLSGTTDLMGKISRAWIIESHRFVEYDLDVKQGECSFIDVPLFIPWGGKNVTLKP